MVSMTRPGSKENDARGRHQCRQADAGRAHMEERAGDEYASVLVEAKRRDTGEARRHDVGVAVHHPLGFAGAAAGVEEGGEIVVATSGIRDRGGRTHERLVGEPAAGRRAFARIDDVSQRFDRGELAGEISVGLVDQQDLRAAIAENAGELGRGQAEVERRHDAARPGRREQGFEIAVAVLGQDGDALARRQPQRPQGAGKPRHPFGEFRPGELALIVGHRQRRAAQPGGPPQGLAEAESWMPRRRSDLVLSLHSAFRSSNNIT
jgi:hypothetical protein